MSLANHEKTEVSHIFTFIVSMYLFSFLDHIPDVFPFLTLKKGEQGLRPSDYPYYVNIYELNIIFVIETSNPLLTSNK